MINTNNSLPASLIKLVQIYAYIILAGVIYGIAAAHVPFLIGKPWTTCDDCSSKLFCVLTFHLFEVPIVLYDLYLCWYSFKRFSTATLQSYISLLNFAVVINFVFFAFEIILLFDNLNDFAPLWENLALTSVALVLLTGSFLTIYVHQKLVNFINN